MKRLWLAVLLLRASVLWAAPAFELEIQAPDEIRQLLAQHLELQRYREMTDLGDAELDRLLGQARQDAYKLVATLGYFSPEIVLERLPVRTDAPGQMVRIKVNPGATTTIRKVTIDFRGAIATDAAATAQMQLIQVSWSLPAGSRFTQSAWDAAKQLALRQLTAQRYPTGRIEAALADIDPEAQLADLALTLDSGAAYRMGQLLVSGSSRYDAALVQRLARLTAGDDYDQTQLLAAQQRLAESGYFDSAYFLLDTAGDPLAAPVLVTLREAKLQKVVFGVGASTDGGPRVSVEHTHHKVPGIDWRAVSTLLLDRETRAIGTELTAPPDNSNWRWVTSGLLQNQRLGSADVTSQRLRFGRNQTGDRIDRTVYLQYDRADTVSSDAVQPESAQSVSANYAFTMRHFDHMPFPSSGWGFGLEVGGGSTLGTQRDAYARVLTRLHGLWPLGTSTSEDRSFGSGRIAWRAAAGAVIAKEGISLPSSQLFLTGGDNSVRGYGLRVIGITLADGQTTAGRYLGVGSIEWQRPIRIDGRHSDWESTLFMDAGAVADKPSDLQAQVGIGAGVRWNSPVGPLQIDLAYGIAVQRLRLHLNVGFTF